MTSILTTQDLTLRLADKTLCHALTLTVHVGDRWGILGPNGCGKSTLLHTLARLQAPTTGDIFLHEQNLLSLTARQIAQQVGVLFQRTAQPFSQSVLESCLAGRHPHLSGWGWESAQDYRIAEQALALMELTAKRTHKINTLSGGEQQRLAIATLLTQQPSLYLLDEPTNHLDIYHQIKILNHFEQLTKTHGVSLVMALHDVNMAAHYCNRIILLFPDGETVQGATDTVLTDNNLQRLYQQPLHALERQQQRYWVPAF